MVSGSAVYDHARSGAHFGALESPTRVGVAGSEGEGPWMRLQFRDKDGVVESARYETYGCLVARACGEAVCSMVEGRDIGTLAGLTAREVTARLEPFPEGKGHCVQLVLDCLREATGQGGPR